jgi:hypothetical protein
MTQIIFRTFKGYTNTDYIADYQIKTEAEMTMRKISNENENGNFEDVI